MQPGIFYHIFNRGNNRETLFREEENHRFFLQRYQHYLASYIDTYAYCLMPNHFHFLIRVSEDVKPPGNSSAIKQLSPLEIAFRDFFKSYAKSYNSLYQRTGSLFQTRFKRKPILDTVQLIQLVLYIHKNPIKAGLCTCPDEWKFSSYTALLGNSPTALKRAEVLDWFGGVNSFKQAHGHNEEVDQDFEDF